MNRLKMKIKFLLMALIPMTLVSVITLSMVIGSQLETLESDVSQYKQTLVEERQANIKDAVLVASSILADVVAQHGTSKEGVLQAQKALGNTKFSGGNGYFFVFDADLTYLVHGAKHSAHGKSGKGLKDPNGLRFVDELQNQAKLGGGFVEYIYAKPGSPTPQPKLAYSAPVQGSGWFVGTGLYIDDIEAAADKYRAQATDALYSSIQGIILITLAVLALTCVVVVFVADKVTKPLRDILATVEDISNGEGDLTHRIEIDGKDEIAQLAKAFNRFISQLHSIISDVASSTAKVTEVTTTISRHSSEINAQLQEHNLETEQVVTAVTEMSSTALQVAENANQVSMATDEANREAGVAQNTVIQSAQAVDSLEHNVETTSSHMNSLHEQSKKIDSVLQVIGDIAEQTNLLALNAAIEAARAGEQGRGFAVVADEVRNLASRTQGSTSEIKEMLDELHRFVEQAVGSMRESSDTCKQVVESTEDISTGLGTVTTAVESINDMTAHIATAATEQSRVTEEISRNLTTIQNIVSSLVVSSEDSHQVSAELTDAGTQLERLVGQFKL